MGSGGGGGNDSFIDTGGYDEAPTRYKQRKEQQKRIQQDVMRQQAASGESAYVTTADRTSTVKSTSGQGVMTSAGRAMEQQARQNELDRTIGSGTGSETLQQRKTDVAIMQMKDRLSKLRYPSTLNVIAAKNLERQIAQLEAGKAQAQFRMSQTGRFIATGTTPMGADGQPSTRDVAPIFSEADLAGGESDSPSGIGGVTTAEQTTTSQAATTSAARRRILAQQQKGQKARIFYQGVRPSGL